MHRSSASIIALVLLSGPVVAQSESVATLDALAAAPKPNRQDDLDTFQLASAHRERAKSLEEKTDGLFQSWVVSICTHCGVDPKPARETVEKAYRGRDAATGAPDKTEEATPQRQATAPVPRPRGTSMAADLSPETVDSIRRMPRQ